MGRYFALLVAISGIVSAIVHPLPNLTGMSVAERTAITTTCLVAGFLMWIAPWDRWSRWSLLVLPPIGMGIKVWANAHGGLGPFSYAIHFALIYVWMGVALPRGVPLAFSPLLALAYVVPLLLRGDPRQSASVAMVVPICVLIGESVAWISSRLREVERVDGLRMKRMAWLVEASSDLAQLNEREALAQRVVGLANDLPGAAGSAVLLPGPDRTVELAAAADWPGPLPERFGLSETPAIVEAMRSGEVLGAGDPGADAMAAELDVPRLAIAPLFGSARCVGVVLLARRAGAQPFDVFTRDLVRTVQLQAGLAIERVRDREALHDATLHDELTGLGNRRKANARLEALAPGDALALVDLDHFKQVNDTHGHAGGDAVLRELAKFLAGALRESDEAYRMGGEEFLLVLSQAGDGAMLATTRLCESWRLSEPITTFSAGVAIHREGETSDATLARADERLYEAKAAGRDRAVGPA